MELNSITGIGMSQNNSNENKKATTTQTVVAVGVSLAVLFATIWVVGRAWKTSQKG